MSSRTIFLIGYLAIGLALIGCQLIALRSERRIARFGEFIDAANRWPPGRVLVLLAWWWVGFHFLARSSAEG